MTAYNVLDTYQTNMAVDQGSASDGASGILTLGAVSAGPSGYISGAMQAISLTGLGRLRTEDAERTASFRIGNPWSMNNPFKWENPNV